MIWLDGHLVSPGPGGVYGEQMVQGLRVWDPKRSKLAALYHIGKGPELEQKDRVLYLGAANGTTVSHIADYTDVVYAVERAPRPMQDLLIVARQRKNIIPILADAGRPELYVPIVEMVDLLYQDVASPQQVDILIRNISFLEPDGNLVLMLKPKCIDVTRSPRDVAQEAWADLEEKGVLIQDQVWLLPNYPDHVAFLCKRSERDKKQSNEYSLSK
jgi:fibrillarin-like pre-rRNA processing protein